MTEPITPAERRRQWEWARLHRAHAGEAVYLAAQGLDPRHPGAGDHLAQLRADRDPR
jgi:hypothetical protein